MTLKKFKLLISLSFLVIFLSPISIFAVAQCEKQGYTIATVNGVFTDEKGAAKNANALFDRIGETYKGEPVNVKYLLNDTHLAGVGDLLTAAYQKYFDSETVEDYDLIEMLQTASEKVATQKLLLVAHSQGNFYANSFYDTTAGKSGGVPPESIGVYAVATPSGRVAGGGKWLTSDTDKVIANVVGRLPFRKIMEPNAHIELKDGDDSFGHDFSGVYLKYQGAEIVSDVEWSLDKLKSTELNRNKTNTEPIRKEEPTTPNPSSRANLTTGQGRREGEEWPCIEPPKLTMAHKAEGAALAVADPVAKASRDGFVFTVGAAHNGAVFVAQIGAQAAGAVSALGNFVAQTTFDATGWTYRAGVALAKAAAGFMADIASAAYSAVKSLVSGGSNLAADNVAAVALAPVQGAQVSGLVYGPMPVKSLAPKAAEPVMVQNINKKPLTPSVTLAVTEHKVQTTDAGSAAEPAPPSTTKAQSETQDIPKIIFIGLPSPGFGGGEARPKEKPKEEELVSTAEPALFLLPLQVSALPAPTLTAPQCDFSLATDGCLVATTTVRFAWAPVVGADYYEVSGNGVLSTTTDTTLDVLAPDFGDYTLAVSAVGTATTSAASTKTVSVATIPIAINEIAWMGTVASTNDEWLELKNNTAHTIDLSQWALKAMDDTPYIALTGAMAPNEYRVLERRKNTITAAATVDNYGNGAPQWALRNSGEELILSYASTTLDSTPPVSGGTWAAGSNSATTRKTMERYASTESGDDASNWGTNRGFIKNGTDTASSTIDGTPGARNSVSYLINRGQDITEDLILTPDDGYFVSTSTAITTSGALSLEPGVIIKFLESENGSSNPELWVLGELRVMGTRQNPVVFEPFVGNQVGAIRFVGGAGATSTIENARMENLNGVLITNSAKVEIRDTQFIGNYYGLEVDGGSVVIVENSNFASTTREAVAAYGGSIVAIASSTITNALDADAIGVYDGTNLTISSSTINRVYSGDGIGAYDSAVTITNSTVSNVLNGDGLGAYDSTLNILDSTVSNVENGDGIGIYGSNVNIVNSTIRDITDGSGIGAYNSAINLSSSTVENISGYGDGLGLYAASSTVANTAVQNGQGDGLVIYGGTATISGGVVSGFPDGAGINVLSPSEPVVISSAEVSGNGTGIMADVADSVSIAPDVFLHDNGADVVTGE